MKSYLISIRSRSALGALKFWWKISKVGQEGYRRQATAILNTVSN